MYVCSVESVGISGPLLRGGKYSWYQFPSGELGIPGGGACIKRVGIFLGVGCGGKKIWEGGSKIFLHETQDYVTKAKFLTP